jgi:hypothetical protein
MIQCKILDFILGHLIFTLGKNLYYVNRTISIDHTIPALAVDAIFHVI